jgi:hypothetical protein
MIIDPLGVCVFVFVLVIYGWTAPQMSVLSWILFLWGSSILIIVAAIWVSNRRHERRLAAMRAEADQKRDDSYSTARARFLP